MERSVQCSFWHFRIRRTFTLFHCVRGARWVRKAINAPGRPQYFASPASTSNCAAHKTFIVFAINLIIFYISNCVDGSLLPGDAHRTARVPTQSSGRWHYKNNDWWSILWFCGAYIAHIAKPMRLCGKKDRITSRGKVLLWWAQSRLLLFMAEHTYSLLLDSSKIKPWLWRDTVHGGKMKDYLEWQIIFAPHFLANIECPLKSNYQNIWY